MGLLAQDLSPLIWILSPELEGRARKQGMSYACRILNPCSKVIGPVMGTNKNLHLLKRFYFDFIIRTNKDLYLLTDAMISF